MKKAILTLSLMSAVLSVFAMPTLARAAGAQAESRSVTGCAAGLRAQQIALYILNDNLGHFGDSSVVKKQFTMEEVFGGEIVSSRADLLKSINSSAEVKRAISQMNESARQYFVNVTRYDIAINISEGSYCQK